MQSLLPRYWHTYWYTQFQAPSILWTTYNVKFNGLAQYLYLELECTSWMKGYVWTRFGSWIAPQTLASHLSQLNIRNTQSQEQADYNCVKLMLCDGIATTEILCHGEAAITLSNGWTRLHHFDEGLDTPPELLEAPRISESRIRSAACLAKELADVIGWLLCPMVEQGPDRVHNQTTHPID